MAAVGWDETPSFHDMSEAELQQWVEARPGRVNDRDTHGWTPLFAAAKKERGLSLVVWLLDDKGADANATMVYGESALHLAVSLDIVNALLDRGADPTLADHSGELPLIHHVRFCLIDIVQCLLQDPRVRATVNVRDRAGNTALDYASVRSNVVAGTAIVHLLLQAGANPLLTDKEGLTPLAWLQQHHPTHHAAIALLEQALAEAEKASLLVKARRLAVAATSNIVAPSCLQARVAQDQPLPRVALAPPVGGQSEEEEEDERKLRTTLALLCGVGREGMPRDVFRVVMDLVMPLWDPLRRKTAGTGRG